MRINTSSQLQKARYPIIGLILAGGRGSRMGGQDKGLLKFEGRPMIEQVLDAARPQCARIIISCNRNIERYESYGHDVVTDTLYPYAGPLSGILEAMTLITNETSLEASLEEGHTVEAATTAQTSWLALFPVDAPRVPDQHILWLYNHILSALNDQESTTDQQPDTLPQAILPEDKQGLQPLFSLISTDSLPSLRSYLGQGDRSVKKWITSLPYLKVQAPNQWGSFVNFNCQEDLLDTRKC